MLNTPDDILSLGELSAVSGGEARQYCVSDPAFQNDVERLIRQWQSSAGIGGGEVQPYRPSV